jgi:predicted acylesterase/phospholipase RssA
MAQQLRVLSLDGGGTRGIYSAEYLAAMSDTFAKKRKVSELDLGGAFDLVVGTSTGAILACAIAAGVPLTEVVSLYRDHGPKIFPKKIPDSIPGVLLDIPKRRKRLAQGAEALRAVLGEIFGDETLGQLYARRGIALAVTAVEMTHHRSWVFKSPHLSNTNHRDDNYTLVDICMASSAAPLFRSLAHVPHPSGSGYNVFADGGLWANTPILVALIDALEMSGPADEIDIFSVGTCPRPAGEQITPEAVNRGYLEWRFGAEAASTSIDAQEFAFTNMARMLTRHLKQRCHVTRFPQDAVPSELSKYLALDETSSVAMDALINVARADANMTNSKCGIAGDLTGARINNLFNNLPLMETKVTHA